MRAVFHLALQEEGRLVGEGYAENMVVDDGIRALIERPSSISLFTDAGGTPPRILIGGSDYPVSESDPGNLKPLFNLAAKSVPLAVDTGEAYMFFVMAAPFFEDDAVGTWRELSYRGWNRALFTAPAAMPDGPASYKVCAFNKNGESLLSSAATTNVSSEGLVGRLNAVRGLTSLPSKIEVLAAGPLQEDTLQAHFYTLTWATEVDGIFEWVAAAQPISVDASHTVDVVLKRDGNYYLRYEGVDAPVVDGVSIAHLPRTGAGEKWRASVRLDTSTLPGRNQDGTWRRGAQTLTESAFWGDTQEAVVDSGSFRSIHQSYFRLTSARLGVLTPDAQAPLPADYGYNPAFDPGTTRYTFDFINATASAIDPTLPRGDRDHHVPFTNFWRTNALGNSLAGEVFEAPGSYRLTMWEGGSQPGADDLSEARIRAAGTTGGVLGTWQHVSTIGPGGWPTGYRVFKRRPDGTYGLLVELPATFTKNPTTGQMEPSGDTHFWDRGDLPIQAANPAPTFSGPSPVTTLTITPKSGLLPKPVVKTDQMTGTLTAQIFFYDAGAETPTSMAILPSPGRVRAGQPLALTAHLANDYGQALGGFAIAWQPPSGGTLLPNGDSATFSANQTGVYSVTASHEAVSYTDIITVVPAVMQSLDWLDPLRRGADGGLLTWVWDAERTTLDVSYPEPSPGVTPDIGLALRVLGTDGFGNTSPDFERSWSLSTSDTLALDGDGLLSLSQHGTGIIEVREVLDDGNPSTIAKTLTITFSWS